MLKEFNVLGSVYRKYIPFDIFPTRCKVTQFIYFWKTALHVSGGIFTLHQEHTQLFLQYLVLVNLLATELFFLILAHSVYKM